MIANQGIPNQKMRPVAWSRFQFEFEISLSKLFFLASRRWIVFGNLRHTADLLQSSFYSWFKIANPSWTNQL